MKSISSFVRAIFLFSMIASFASESEARSLEEAIEKLPVKTFCVNAGLATTWQETANVLRRMEIPTTLADESHHIVTTAFVAADYAKLYKIAGNARPFSKGKFTLKITMEEVTPSFTKLHMVLQIRQNKLMGKSEKLLKARGQFEKYLAYLINEQAIAVEHPAIYEIRLGMSLIPDLQKELYRIAKVERDSPAGESGFREGDWLLAIDGQKISIRGELFDVLIPQGNEKLAKFLIRGGSREFEIPLWIVKVKMDDEKLGWKLKKDDRTGKMQVKYVAPGSLAERAGISAGDIILEVQGMKLSGWSDYYRALARADGTAALKLALLHKPGEAEQVLEKEIPLQ